MYHLFNANDTSFMNNHLIKHNQTELDCSIYSKKDVLKSNYMDSPIIIDIFFFNIYEMILIKIVIISHKLHFFFIISMQFVSRLIHNLIYLVHK